jgi:NAD(P)-dependent dehydrogenase (short-subunit alcohol dehydrogenase family)
VTKAALASFTRAWAAEFGSAGVRVNISPGPVSIGAQRAGRTELLSATTPLGRAAEAEEIAPLVAFPASHKAIGDEASQSRAGCGDGDGDGTSSSGGPP